MEYVQVDEKVVKDIFGDMYKESIMLLRELAPEKYWSFPSSYSKEKRETEIQNMILSGKYYYQLKTDGNYSAFICDFDGEKSIIHSFPRF